MDTIIGVKRRDFFPGVCVLIALLCGVTVSWWLAAAWFGLAVVSDMAYQLSATGDAEPGSDPSDTDAPASPDWARFSDDVANGRHPGRKHKAKSDKR